MEIDDRDLEQLLLAFTGTRLVADSTGLRPGPRVPLAARDTDARVARAVERAASLSPSPPRRASRAAAPLQPTSLAETAGKHAPGVTPLGAPAPSPRPMSKDEAPAELRVPQLSGVLFDHRPRAPASVVIQSAQAASAPARTPLRATHSLALAPASPSPPGALADTPSSPARTAGRRRKRRSTASGTPVISSSFTSTPLHARSAEHRAARAERHRVLRERMGDAAYEHWRSERRRIFREQQQAAGRGEPCSEHE